MAALQSALQRSEHPGGAEWLLIQQKTRQMAG
jgi:hypothetical protein